MKNTNKKKEKHSITKSDDIYKLFNITDDKKRLFHKMETEWSVIPPNQEIKSYEFNPINTTIKGYDNA